MTYIQNELLTITSGTTYYLSNPFKDGTTTIIYNNVLLYEYRELTSSGIVFDFEPSLGDVIDISYHTLNTANVLNAIRYATPQQVRNISRAIYNNSFLGAGDTYDSSSQYESDTPYEEGSTLSNASLEQIIREAENLIDRYCGGWEKANDYVGQRLTFPRLCDSPDYNVDIDLYGNSSYAGIPKAITLATIYATEYIFLQGVPNSDNINHGVYQSEQIGEYTFRRNEQMMRTIAQQLGPKTVSILRGYIKNYGKILPRARDYDTLDTSHLNSRQSFLKGL